MNNRSVRRGNCEYRKCGKTWHLPNNPTAAVDPLGLAFDPTHTGGRKLACIYIECPRLEPHSTRTRRDWTLSSERRDFCLLLIFITLFLFVGSVRQKKLAVRQLSGAYKYSLSYRVVSRPKYGTDNGCFVDSCSLATFKRKLKTFLFRHAFSSS